MHAYRRFQSLEGYASIFFFCNELVKHAHRRLVPLESDKFSTSIPRKILPQNKSPLGGNFGFGYSDSFGCVAHIARLVKLCWVLWLSCDAGSTQNNYILKRRCCMSHNCWMELMIKIQAKNLVLIRICNLI